MYRDVDSIPVLAPEGAIIPMYENDRSNDLSLDQTLELHIYRGNGRYELYEDDGLTNAYKNGAYALTEFTVEEKDGKIKFCATPVCDERGILPKERKIKLVFCDIEAEDMIITLSDEPVTVELKDVKPRVNEDEGELKNAILTRVQGSNLKKTRAFKKDLPKYVKDIFSEFDALWRE
jgi:hypothetical protein